jgi:hypothetical protein
VIPAQTFAQQLLQTIEGTNSSTNTAEEPAMNPDELDDWLKLFGESDENS